MKAACTLVVGLLACVLFSRSAMADLDMTCRTTQFGGSTGTPTIECVFEWDALDALVTNVGQMYCIAADSLTDDWTAYGIEFDVYRASTMECWIDERRRPHPCQCTLEALGSLYLQSPFFYGVPFRIPHPQNPVEDSHTRRLP